ncbi:hypothetical protein HOLleu_43697 [Holothuria leucospilota]|uniref:Transposable element P transposase-like GTP-binding insertion domain-containing protein n=1 Tax=Holothuria leucospilota TaxID=206669 RepID=A0A9Q0YBB7_HOLLE|nr:hypothetical protein HOLleu_43697 [Holothuria leucospilota]
MKLSSIVLQPPNIVIHVFTEHDPDCQICADRQWNDDVLLEYFQRKGMFVWKEEEEVVGVVVDRDLSKKWIPNSGNAEFQELADASKECGLKSQTGETIATVEAQHYDGRILQSKYSIRHANCEMIIPQSIASASNRSLYLCHVCAKYRSSLQRKEQSHKSRQGGKAKSVPIKFLSPKELRGRIDELKREKVTLSQQKRRLRDKVEQLMKEESVEVMEEEAEKLHDIVLKSKSSIESLLPPGSCCDLLWRQQMEAASKPAKQMRWHPAVLRWAVAIHTKSAAAYTRGECCVSPYGDSCSHHLNTQCCHVIHLQFRGQRIQWTDIIAFMEWDQGIHRANPGLRLTPKVTPEHLYLTPGLRMKVRLAAQVMSNTVANGLEMMKKKHLSSTILLLRNVNKFFDCLNVARQDQGLRSRNENLKPYTSLDEPRFEVCFIQA